MLCDRFQPPQVHGWPDLAFGWRYQIPALIELGFRVVAPDMMGYGGTVSFLPPFPGKERPLRRASRCIQDESGRQAEDDENAARRGCP